MISFTGSIYSWMRYSYTTATATATATLQLWLYSTVPTPPTAPKEPEVRRADDNLGLSIFTCLCCSPIFSLPGLILSVLSLNTSSYSKAKRCVFARGNGERAFFRLHRRIEHGFAEGRNHWKKWPVVAKEWPLLSLLFLALVSLVLQALYRSFLS